VLAGGCGSKTLVRIGGGNLKSAMVFIILGLTAFMTLKGILALPRVNVLESASLTLSTTQDLPSVMSGWFGDKRSLQLITGGIIGLALLVFVFANRSFLAAENLVGGIVVGAVIVAAWYVSGRLGYVAEDPDTLQEAFVATNSRKMESLSFVAPFAYTLDLLMMWTDKSKAVTFGIAATLGIICGSFAYALATRTFRWEGFTNVDDLAHHMAGAVLMGFGGVTAVGCTIGQGLSGVSTLSLGSFITFASIVAGALVSLRYQEWRIERMIS
jgi:uncharacterized membrane protein YedE/YeeE